MSWRDHAKCRGMDPDFFFPGRGENSTKPKQVCEGCEVRTECLAEGLMERQGVWGGASEHERRALRRQMPTSGPAHGTTTRYRRGCRCVECGLAASEYRRANRWSAA